VGVAVTLVFLIVVLDFIIQNLHTTTIHFFNASFGLPVGVAMIAAAVAGAVLVVVSGWLRIGQLRLRFRRHRRNETHRGERD
jgi:uncharacterized integral membrane protein